MEITHIFIAEYVKRAQGGDSDAFAFIYNATFNKVYNYARHYLKDEYLAQDAVQEVYISALKNLQKLNDPTLFVAWLHQIAFHVCYDLAKAQSSKYGEVNSELLEDICEMKPDSNPEESTFINDEKERLKNALDLLTPSERELVTLRYFNSMKIDEIVNATKKSKSTVKRQLNDVVEKLRRLMKE